MSTSIICAVYDIKLQEYGNPMFFPSIGVAERSFIQEVKRDEKTALQHFPADFSLYAVGKYYSETGHIDSFDPPVLIIDGKSVI